MNESTAAIVTGASRGIGEAIARALAANGTPLGLIARDPERLRATAEAIAAKGGTVAFRAVDITDAEAVDTAVAELAAELDAPIGLLVNNAGGIDREVPLWEADPEEWRSVVELNLIGSFNVSRAVIPRMLSAGGGRVIDLASGIGAQDAPVASAYAASKGALHRNVGHLHQAGYALGLRSFAVAPGVVKTDMTGAMAMHAGRTEFTPVSRMTDMVLAIHRGELDNWSGKFLRVTHDTPESLAAYEQAHGKPSEKARRLAIIPWGDDDPQAG